MFSHASAKLSSMSKNPIFLFVFMCVCLTFAGCAPSPVVPVSGTLTFADREIPEVCRLTFVPKDVEGGGTIRPNGATMEPDGTYQLTPFKGVEGLLPGRYAVRISYFDLKKNGNPDREGDWKEFTYDAEDLVVEEGSDAITHDIVVR